MQENKNTGKIKIKESEFRILIQNVIRTVLKEDVESDQFINMEQLIDIAKKAGDYVLDAKYAVEDLGIAYGDKIPSDAVVDVLHEYDITIDDLYGGESEGLMEELVFSVNDGNKINQIFQANNIEYKYKNDGDDITFIFPSNQERENAMRLIAIAIKDKKLKIKGEGDPNYDWIHNDMFESKNNPKKIKKSEFKRLVRNTIDKIIFESKSIKENYDELDVDERSNWDEFFGFGGDGFEILENYGWAYVDTKENDLIDSIGIVPDKRNAVSFETLLGYLRKYVPEIEVIGKLKHRYAPELRPTIFIGVRKDNNLNESNDEYFKVFDIKNNKLVKTFNTKPEAESFINNFEGDMVMDDDGQWVDLGDNLKLVKTTDEILEQMLTVIDGSYNLNGDRSVVLVQESGGGITESKNYSNKIKIKESQLRNLIKNTVKCVIEKKNNLNESTGRNEFLRKNLPLGELKKKLAQNTFNTELALFGHDKELAKYVDDSVKDIVIGGDNFISNFDKNGNLVTIYPNMTERKVNLIKPFDLISYCATSGAWDIIAIIGEHYGLDMSLIDKTKKYNPELNYTPEDPYNSANWTEDYIEDNGDLVTYKYKNIDFPKAKRVATMRKKKI